MNDLIKAALEYRQAGFSIIPVRENKHSLGSWKIYQNEIMPVDLLFELFTNNETKGIAVVCGAVSGNLGVIDMDSKYDLTGSLFERYCEILYKRSQELYKKIPIAITRNKGYHFFYKCPGTGKYKCLAKRDCTDSEKVIKPDEKFKVLIELKANGGYVVVHPTIGYRFIQHDLNTIPVIETEEQELLFTIARSFNGCKEKEPGPIKSHHVYIPSIYDPESPFDDYDNRTDVLYALIDLLTKHGWKKVRSTSLRTYFCRPGNANHETSGDYHHLLGLFGVFSPNTEFEVSKGYKPHAVFAILECGGDFKLAAKQLLKQGYGVAYNKRKC